MLGLGSSVACGQYSLGGGGSSDNAGCYSRKLSQGCRLIAPEYLSVTAYGSTSNPFETSILVWIYRDHSIETQEWKRHQGDNIFVRLTQIINHVRVSERLPEDRRLILLEKKMETSWLAVVYWGILPLSIPGNLFYPHLTLPQKYLPAEAVANTNKLISWPTDQL